MSISAFSSLIHQRYYKMNGIGNKILILDLRRKQEIVTARDARRIAQHPLFAYDQLMVLYNPIREGSQALMHIYNQDGSPTEACGNGTRCVAAMLMRHSSYQNISLDLYTKILRCTKETETIFSVDMGEPLFEWYQIPLAAPYADTSAIVLESYPELGKASVVNVGNPHIVFRILNLNTHSLATLGPQIEHHPLFPERVNVSFSQILSPTHIVLQVWERGAGLTQACGSAACAAVVTAARAGATERKVKVSLPGGELTIEWRLDNHILMRGEVEFESEGELPEDLLLYTDQTISQIDQTISQDSQTISQDSNQI